MQLHRRQILSLAIGASLLGPARAFAGTGTDAPRFAACARLADGRFAAVLLDEAGVILGHRPLPGRGHEIAHHAPSGRFVAFARRPGSFLAAFGDDPREAPQIVSAAPGRSLYGHGAFSPDGALLYATENDAAAARGVIGVYDVRAGYARIGEFSSGGVGPHELLLMEGGRTLAIANGGLDTTPEFGRLDLNTAEMAPSLALVDVATERVVAVHDLGADHAQLSIRHLAAAEDGSIWFGCQHEGAPTELPPLAGRLSEDGAMELLALPEGLRARPRNYVGAVSASRDGGIVAFSAPRGNVVFAFDAATRRFLGLAPLADGCGIAPGLSPDEIVGAGGEGDVVRFAFAAGEEAARPVRRDDLAFDNHLTLL